MGISTLTNLNSKSRKSKALVAATVASALALGACVSPVAMEDGRYTHHIGNAPVISNETPYSASLSCLGAFARTNIGLTPRIAVGNIADYTGKEEFEGGRRVTQGAALMAMSALDRGGVRLLERFDTSVSELELRYANNRLIGEDTGDWRRVTAGSIPGSDYYLVGGITELNYNIRSNGAEASGGDPSPTDPIGTFGISIYVMDVGIDLRLVDTRSLEVVDVISYQKQIIGREISAGVFDFFNGNIVDVSVGERALEPIQLAVRAVIERATLEMISHLYNAGPEVCADIIAESGDPIGAPNGRRQWGNDQIATEEHQRRDPDRWHERRDDTIRATLRGRMH